MKLLLWLALAGATWLSSLVKLGGGGAAWLVPSVPLCGVLLVARWSQPRRYRTTAVSLGILAGLPLQGMLLVPAVVLLLIGGLAHATRRMFPVRGFMGMFVIGLIFGCVEGILLLLFPGTGATLKLAPGDWPGAIGGLLLTGVAYAVLESTVRGGGRLRYALERH